jgi:hypothetical protein
MASGNEHVNLGLVVRVEGPYTAIASQKGSQQCCILGRVLQMDDLGRIVNGRLAMGVVRNG